MVRQKSVIMRESKKECGQRRRESQRSAPLHTRTKIERRVSKKVFGTDYEIFHKHQSLEKTNGTTNRYVIMKESVKRNAVNGGEKAKGVLRCTHALT